MEDEFPTRRLGEVCEIVMGQSPPGSSYNESGKGLPFFQGVADFGSRYPTRRVWCSAPSRIADRGDVLLSIRAPIGNVNLASERCAVGRGLAIIRARSREDQTFVEFTLRSARSSWEAMEGSGTVFANATRSQLETLEVPWPNPDSRNAIARVLGSLDDKIELNRRMNQTLEEICRALFKFWFVDFGPVRAKAEGRWKKGESLPGMPSNMWDLWPSDFEESEIGEIPKGWEAGTLRDVLSSLESGSRPNGGASENPDGGVPSVGAENVLGLGRYDYSRTKYVPRSFFAEMKRGVLQRGDVLLYKDGAQLGRRSYFDYGFPFEECCVNEHVFILRARPPLTQRFLYFWLDQDRMADEIVSRNAGSAQPGLNQPSVYGLPILRPSQEIAQAFDSTAAPLTRAIFSNELASRTLASARDALLPKLLSGEIRVPLGGPGTESSA